MKAFLKYYIKDRWSLWRQKQQLQHTRSIPILVFTMAKVGSLSVYQSLKNQLQSPIFHIHSLDEAEELAHINNCKKKGVYPGSRTPAFLINKEIIAPKKPVKIISLVRNPIERNISAFFDAFEYHMGVSPLQYGGSLDDLETAFFNYIDHTYAIDWFEKQFYTATNINIYQHPFDKAHGYAQITLGTIDVLLLRSDLPDTIKEQQLANFCGLGNVTLHNVNVTSTKKEAKLYEAFKAHIKFSKAYLQQQLESSYAKHFFTSDEIEALYKKWVKES